MQGGIVKFSPLIRRVSIYLVLSTIAVISTNVIGIEQEGAFKIYVPLFIAIYIVSRWIDSKFTQSRSAETMDEGKHNPSKEKGFAKNRNQQER